MIPTTRLLPAALLVLCLTPGAWARGQALREKYSVKVHQNSLASTEFTLKINGEVVGSYSDDAQVDVTDRMRPGKNTVTVGWKNSIPFTNPFATTTLTLGVYRSGHWSTAMNVGAKKALPKGTRSVILTAR